VRHTNDPVPSRRLIGIAVIVAACHGQDIVHRPGEVYLDEIRIEGNHAIDASDLIGGLALHRAIGRDIDPIQVENDRERIAGAFYKLGFFHVAVAVRVDPLGDRRIVVFTVVEGKRATLAHVSFPGLPDEIPEAKVRALVKLADGAPFDYDPYDDASSLLVRLLQDAGYAHAHVQGTVIADRKNDQAVVEYDVKPGPRCTFAAPELIPANTPLADAIHDRIAFHRGEAFSNGPIEATQRALYAMGRFSSVRVEPDVKDKAVTAIPVKVIISEANAHELKFGIGAGLDPADYQVRFRALYTQNGLWDPLVTLSTEGRVALTYPRDDTAGQGFQPLYRLIVRLSRTDLGRPDLKGDIEGGADYQTVEAYTLEGFRGRLGLSSPLGTPKLQLQIGWQIARYTFSTLSPALAPAGMPTQQAIDLGLTGVERIAAFTQAIVADFRDSPVEPHSGFYGAFAVAEGTKFAGSALSYQQVSPEVRGYVSLGPAVLAARFRLATITGDVPVTERLYGGGPSSHRGFGTRQLSPIAGAVQPDMSVAQVVIGGAGLVETGLELRFPIGKVYGLKLGSVVFLDGGDCTPTAGDLDLTNLYYAVGSGIRILTAIGAIRLEVGYRLNRFSPTDLQAADGLFGIPHTAGQFSIGEAF
jgi:outer membrane protein assembly factor BamA